MTRCGRDRSLRSAVKQRQLVGVDRGQVVADGRGALYQSPSDDVRAAKQRTQCGEEDRELQAAHDTAVSPGRMTPTPEGSSDGPWQTTSGRSWFWMR